LLSPSKTMCRARKFAAALILTAAFQGTASADNKKASAPAPHPAPVSRPAPQAPPPMRMPNTMAGAPHAQVGTPGRAPVPGARNPTTRVPNGMDNKHHAPGGYEPTTKEKPPPKVLPPNTPGGRAEPPNPPIHGPVDPPRGPGPGGTKPTGGVRPPLAIRMLHW
jgi:hypothetical protein